MNATQIVPIVIKAISQAAAFEAGQPVSIAVPAETVTIDLTAEGVGKVTVTESGTTISIAKAS